MYYYNPISEIYQFPGVSRPREVVKPTGKAFKPGFKEPESFHQIMRMSELAYRWSPLGQVVSMLAGYPLTPLVIKAPDESLKDKAKTVLESLDIERILPGISLDLHVYGNFFWAGAEDYERVIDIFTDTGVSLDKTISLSSIKGYRIKPLHMGDPSSKRIMRIMEERGIDGIPVRVRIDGKDRIGILRKKSSVRNVRLFKYNPFYINIDYIPSANLSIKVYTIPEGDRVRIMSGDPIAINSIPLSFIDAVVRGHSSVILPDETHVFLPAPTGLTYGGWGLPITMPALKAYRIWEFLMNATEEILKRYALPLIILFPQPTASFDIARLNIGRWVNTISNGIREFLRNSKKGIITAPYPTGVQNLFPIAEQLIPTSEMGNTANIMFASLGIPKAVYEGGGTWAQNAAAMRMLSYRFGVLRRSISNMITSLVRGTLERKEGVSQEDASKVEIEMEPLPWTDDPSKLMVLWRLVESKYITPDTVLESMGIEPEEFLRGSRERMKQWISNMAFFQAEMKKQLSIEMEKATAELSKSSGALPEEVAPLVTHAVAQLLARMDPESARQQIESLRESLPVLAESVEAVYGEIMSEVSKRIRENKQNG